MPVQIGSVSFDIEQAGHDLALRGMMRGEIDCRERLCR
jgi:hypothetical protein